MGRSPHAGHRPKPDDLDVLHIAVLASLLTAVMVELRHRRLVAGAEADPHTAPARRARFLLETWALSGVALLALVLATPSLR
jgi:hypothetical protein